MATLFVEGASGGVGDQLYRHAVSRLTVSFMFWPFANLTASMEKAPIRAQLPLGEREPSAPRQAFTCL